MPWNILSVIGARPQAAAMPQVVDVVVAMPALESVVRLNDVTPSNGPGK
ncbi:hypothetical protein GEM_5687 [Burkholderia cepacia GG4]|uniref:Uncharacterized protein n=1 Tax=Burkholderia cepacia GG4 TaxID=1009846 RepID=A0A9W3PCX8_BURCE|nr:hypothetical protein GEM_5687 [Burkholderia cepacia GG4]